MLDYKTNWLGEPDEPLTAFHYRPEALRAEMERHHYALQGLLYAVALHRYLRWRLPAYDPDAHLAGVVYLFVRGMTGGGGLDAAPAVRACSVGGPRPDSSRRCRTCWTGAIESPERRRRRAGSVRGPDRGRRVGAAA